MRTMKLWRIAFMIIHFMSNFQKSNKIDAQKTISHQKVWPIQ